ncbi:MAG: hypothetical protein DRH26_14945 [Deltaproteobacteria bacterium]|nr:MAG: hypothetical protein DRH26_14945 [Deltaproteobacteria bacterium]
MLKFLNKLFYSVLILASIFMLITPISPMPHVVEKILMIKNGTLYNRHGRSMVFARGHNEK